ncbi:hypothetical protein Fmac_025327 [Flemingia macrophylla]|uniref:Gnk2-homologous domain-containing protein n=1 Tax=Flemingia macrophylla TaxID=520843 RepID=A0ABD1LRY7_9FABA
MKLHQTFHDSTNGEPTMYEHYEEIQHQPLAGANRPPTNRIKRQYWMAKFWWDPIYQNVAKIHMMKDIGKKWKENMLKLFNTYFDETKSRDENAKNHPLSITEIEGTTFIDYRLKEKTKEKISEIESEGSTSIRISPSDSLGQVSGKEHSGREYKVQEMEVAHPNNYTTPKPLSSAFQTNLKSVLSWLSGDAATSKGYNHNSFGNNTPGDAAAYGLYDCRGDVAGYFCQFCVSTATSEVLQRCPSRESAIIWYDFCLLRYSNENFFGNVTVYPSWHGTGKKNVSGAEEIQKGEDFMRSLIRKATVETNQLYYMDAFNLSSSQRRYGLVQCGRDLTNHRCRQCLEALLAQVRECCEHNLGWFVGTASCLVKYDDYIFYNPPSSVSVSGSRKGETSIAFYSDVVTLFSHLNLKNLMNN